jgi:UDP-2,4-diacetamido-2,4,6-trideoxy-beta-L-altropyranose hydrolase
VRNVVFRVDSSPEIGGGHLRRCLALASELRARQADIVFVCRNHRGNLNSEVAESGFALRELSSVARITRQASSLSQHADWLAANPEEDAADTLNALVGWGAPHALVVDHYGVEATWEGLLRKHVPRIIAIDDLADRQHACDVLVDYTPIRLDHGRYAGLVEAGTELLLGSRYALLRSEFSEKHRSPRSRDGSIRSIFVSFGAVDSAGYTLRAAKALRSAVGPAIRLEVVVGKMSPHLSSLKDYCASQPSTTLHVGARDVADVMQQCDVAVISSGVTAFECACIGLPMILAPIVPNQAEVARSLCAIPCALSARGDLDFERQIGELASAMLSQSQLVQELGRNAHELVDGCGAARVARTVLPAVITIKRADSDDIRDIWEWRNHERVRSMSRSTAPIPWDEHESWCRRALKDPRCVLLIAQCDYLPIAVIRFDLSVDDAEVSIYLTAGAHGRGLARQALIAAERWMKHAFPNIRSIRAETRPENAAAIAAFTQAGYAMHAFRFRKELSEKNGH